MQTQLKVADVNRSLSQFSNTEILTPSDHFKNLQFFVAHAENRIQVAARTTAQLANFLQELKDEMSELQKTSPSSSPQRKEDQKKAY